MSTERGPRINYNHEALEQILGGSIPPINHDADNQRRAARVLTDSIHCHEEYKPPVKFNNAVSWLDDAYNSGVETGILQERRAWEQKILSLFGMVKL